MADRDGVSTHVGLGSHNLDAEYVCADCGMVDEASRGAELLALRARVAELEAAQRQPIGYVALVTRDDGRLWVYDPEPRSREEAQRGVDYEQRGGFAARLIELREVGDRG